MIFELLLSVATWLPVAQPAVVVADATTEEEVQREREKDKEDQENCNSSPQHCPKDMEPEPGYEDGRRPPIAREYFVASTSFNSRIIDTLEDWGTEDRRQDLPRDVAICVEHFRAQEISDFDLGFATVVACLWAGRTNAQQILNRAGDNPNAITDEIEAFHEWFLSDGTDMQRAWAAKRVRLLREYLEANR